MRSTTNLVSWVPEVSLAHTPAEGRVPKPVTAGSASEWLSSRGFSFFSLMSGEDESELLCDSLTLDPVLNCGSALGSCDDVISMSPLSATLTALVDWFLLVSELISNPSLDLYLTVSEFLSSIWCCDFLVEMTNIMTHTAPTTKAKTRMTSVQMYCINIHSICKTHNMYKLL